MKFTKQKELYGACRSNEKKIVRKFLWWPIEVYNKEVRWLEWATIEYRADWEEGVFFGRTYYWRPWMFIDKSE